MGGSVDAVTGRRSVHIGNPGQDHGGREGRRDRRGRGGRRSPRRAARLQAAAEARGRGRRSAACWAPVGDRSTGSTTTRSTISSTAMPTRPGLSGIVCVPKKGEARPTSGVDNRRRWPVCVSAPSARDRGFLGVPFASSRLSPGDTNRRASRGKNARSA